MRWINIVARRARSLFRRQAIETEMSDELRLHFDMAVADGMRRGLSREQALRDARVHFGGVERVKEEYRDARGVRMIEEVLADLRHGVRALRKAPAFTLVVLATLTLGIGANTAIFSVVRGVLLRDLPYADASRLTMVWETDRNSHTDSEAASVPDYFDFVARNRSFSSLTGFYQQARNYVTRDGIPERVNVTFVTGNFLPTLGVSPMLGRGFTDAEDQQGGPRAVVVSEQFWRSRLSADVGAIGRPLRLDDDSYVVVGVVPRAMQFPAANVDLFVPLQLTLQSGPRDRHWIGVVGRLRPSVTQTAAQVEMAKIAAQLETEYPRANAARGVRVEALEQTLLGPVRPALAVLLAAVALVLLIACVNVANLMLARLAARGREVAVRAALGATRTRLAQQFVVESLLLTVVASIAALALAPATLRVLVALAPSSLPRLDEVRLDGAVLAVTFGIGITVALAFGVLPAMASRKMGLADALRAGQRGGANTPQHQRLRATLVTAEVALAIVLVIGAGLLMQSFWRLRRVDPGWATSNLLRVQFQLPSTRYPQSFSNFPVGWGKMINFERDLVERTAALPGVKNAALAASDPLNSGFTNSFVIEGRDPASSANQAELTTRPVSMSYFATVGVPLLRGRQFESTDVAESPAVLIINDAAAKRYFPNENPVGRRLAFWGSFRTIVGVVGNERFAGLSADPPPAMYPPITQAPMSTASLLVRTDGDPTKQVDAVKNVLWGLDRAVAPYGVSTMEDLLSASVSQQRFTMQLLVAFAALALGLALVGIYGVVSYGVAQRTQEIGVRMALGATRRDVIGYVLKGGARLAIIGALVGSVAALAATRLLATQLYEVKPSDPATFVAAILGTMLAALLGSYLPARRASRVTPVTALRAE